MDPVACIEEAEAQIESNNPDDAAWALQEYREWRREGGFVSTELDERAHVVNKEIKQTGHPGCS